jgi:H/ACA ribonucleoprotein complex subunit 1
MRGGRGGGRGFGGGDRGGRGGGGRFGGGGRGGGGRGGWQDYGPPESVVEAGAFAHACEGEAVVKLTNEKVGTRALRDMHVGTFSTESTQLLTSAAPARTC